MLKITIWILINYCALGLNEVIEKKSDPKIVIIGAGPSGIAAASKLFENNFMNVTILEAENRIGGRVFTTQFGNYSVDVGGQWVHGVKNNVAFELANVYGLLDNPEESGLDEESGFAESSENTLSDDIFYKYANFYDKYVDGLWFGTDSKYASSGEYIKKMFDEEFKNDTFMIDNKKKFLDTLELTVLSMDPAESWFNVSTASVFKECEGNQEVNWKERGYSTILDILMKRYPNPENELPVLNNTILNSEVNSIDYSKDDDQILITTTSGKTYKADHVIVTVSLGVLKEKHSTLFVPALPEKKVKAIEAIGFGNVAKILLLFNEPFWPAKDNKIMYHTFFWNEADRKLIEEDSEKSWVLGIPGVHNVEHKPNLLEVWLSGKYATIMEFLPEDKVFRHSVEIIHKFFDKKYNVTDPIAMLRSTWSTNPHFRGTYSYSSVEAKKNNISLDDIESPITPENLRILFAGEATMKHRYGTVDGAIVSGWKAAERLLNFYNVQDTTKNSAFNLNFYN